MQTATDKQTRCVSKKNSVLLTGLARYAEITELHCDQSAKSLRSTTNGKRKKEKKVTLSQSMKTHKDSRGTVPLILQIGARCRCAVNFKPTRFDPRKESRYAMNTRLGGPQNRSGHLWAEIHLLPLPRSAPLLIQFLLNYENFVQIGLASIIYMHVNCSVFILPVSFHLHRHQLGKFDWKYLLNRCISNSYSKQ